MGNIWSVYDRDGRLVLGISDEPGIFNFAKPPADEVDPVECEFGTFQCYDVRVESEFLNLLDSVHDLEMFFEALLDQGYNIVPGQPRPGHFARL